MTSSRRMMIALLLCGALAGRGAAQALPAGVTLAWLGSEPRVGQAELVHRCLAELRAVVGPADQLAGDLPAESILDDLRQLPARLVDWVALHPAALRTRSFLALRIGRLDDRPLLAEVALIDLTEARLLGYRTLSLSEADLPASLPHAVAQFAGEVLGVSEAGRRPTPVPSPVPAVGSARLASDTSAALVRDAADDQPLPAAPFVSSRPRPVAAPMPTAAAASHAAALSDRALPDLDLVLRQFGGRVLGLGGLGTATARPHVLENSFRLLLIPSGNADPAAPPVTMVVTVYAVGDQARVESRFSRVVPLQLVGRSGTYVSADIPGYRVEAESLVDVDRSGLISIQVRPTDQGGTRLTFRLTGAGEANLEKAKDGQILLATVHQSAERQRRNEVEGDLPWDGNFQVVRSAVGVASWYGGADHGGPTASGERYNQWGWTAAHRTLPMGSWVRVTNVKNGKQVVLRINDRGPYIGGRIIDVSAAGAQALGFYGSGLATVEVEVLQKGR